MIPLTRIDGDPERRLPPWFKVRIQAGPRFRELQRIVRDRKLHTVCEEARCPNLWDCWNRGTATFMILGDICTRSCGFCAVTTGRPTGLDRDEPARVGEAVRALELRHAVITSVNRDELKDGGAAIFAATIREVRRQAPDCGIEVLIPDFKGCEAALATVLEAGPDILNHNLETVPRLYRRVRPQAQYDRSIALLCRAKEAGAATKTGIMVGLGETEEELLALFSDVAAIRCDILTIGQYLRPTREHLPVERFYAPEEFTRLKRIGESRGIRHVEAGPLVRSSYHAEEQVELLAPRS